MPESVRAGTVPERVPMLRRTRVCVSVAGAAGGSMIEKTAGAGPPKAQAAPKPLAKPERPRVAAGVPPEESVQVSAALADADVTTVAVQDCPASREMPPVVVLLEKPVPETDGATPSAGRGPLLVSVKVRPAARDRGSGLGARLTEKILPPLPARWGTKLLAEPVRSYRVSAASRTAMHAAPFCVGKKRIGIIAEIGLRG